MRNSKTFSGVLLFILLKWLIFHSNLYKSLFIVHCFLLISYELLSMKSLPLGCKAVLIDRPKQHQGTTVKIVLLQFFAKTSTSGRFTFVNKCEDLYHLTANGIIYQRSSRNYILDVHFRLFINTMVALDLIVSLLQMLRRYYWGKWFSHFPLLTTMSMKYFVTGFMERKEERIEIFIMLKVAFSNQWIRNNFWYEIGLSLLRSVLLEWEMLFEGCGNAWFAPNQFSVALLNLVWTLV